MEKQVVYLFLGSGPEVGKSTLGKQFAESHGLKHGTTSDIIIETFAQELYHLFGGFMGATSWYAIYEKIKSNKEAWRPWLVWYGNRMCDDDPACLAGELINRGCSVVDGIRRQCELDLIRERYDCHVFWIERPGYPKKLDNTDITKPNDAVTILNDFETKDIK